MMSRRRLVPWKNLHDVGGPASRFPVFSSHTPSRQGLGNTVDASNMPPAQGRIFPAKRHLHRPGRSPMPSQQLPRTKDRHTASMCCISGGTTAMSTCISTVTWTTKTTTSVLHRYKDHRTWRRRRLLLMVVVVGNGYLHMARN